ncbi:calponin-homology (CH) domain-containing protein, partial [Haematococcus lacustris]
IIASKVAAHAKSSKAGVALWERPDLSAAFSDIGPGGTLHALGRDEFATVKQHNTSNKLVAEAIAAVWG